MAHTNLSFSLSRLLGTIWFGLLHQSYELQRKQQNVCVKSETCMCGVPVFIPLRAIAHPQCVYFAMCLYLHVLCACNVCLHAILPVSSLLRMRRTHFLWILSSFRDPYPHNLPFKCVQTSQTHLLRAARVLFLWSPKLVWKVFFSLSPRNEQLLLQDQKVGLNESIKKMRKLFRTMWDRPFVSKSLNRPVVSMPSGFQLLTTCSHSVSPTSTHIIWYIAISTGALPTGGLHLPSLRKPIVVMIDESLRRCGTIFQSY